VTVLRKTRTALVPGLNWLNPERVFGEDPIGFAAAPAYAARFTGQLMLPDAGRYAFNLNANAGADLRIDGRVISGVVELAAGPHAVEVLYRKASDAAALELLQQPDGVGAPVPLDRITASDPALTVSSGIDGAFTIRNFPAALEWVRAIVQLPDGRSVASDWQAPANGNVTDIGNIVLDSKQ
jgi:hypothetical protein